MKRSSFKYNGNMSSTSNSKNETIWLIWCLNKIWTNLEISSKSCYNSIFSRIRCRYAVKKVHKYPTLKSDYTSHQKPKSESIQITFDPCKKSYLKSRFRSIMCMCVFNCIHMFPDPREKNGRGICNHNVSLDLQLSTSNAKDALHR